jgi:hypothetical protein
MMGDLPQTSFAEIAIGLFEEAKHYEQSNESLDELAGRLARAGLSGETRQRIMKQAQRQAQLVADAHVLFRAMCEHEAAIRRIIAPKPHPVETVAA